MYFCVTGLTILNSIINIYFYSGWSGAPTPPAAAEACGAPATGQHAAAHRVAATAQRAGATAEVGGGPQRLLEKRKYILTLPINLYTYTNRYLLFIWAYTYLRISTFSPLVLRLTLLTPALAH